GACNGPSGRRRGRRRQGSRAVPDDRLYQSSVRRPGCRPGTPEGPPLVIAVIIAGAVSTLVSLFFTRFLITFFATRGQGQPILGKEDLGPDWHAATKQGTPTMGGLAIIVAALVGWVVAHVRNIAFSDQAMIVWVGVLAMAAMGFADDWIKVRKRHNRGIFWKQKNYITMLMAIGLCGALAAFTGIDESVSLVRA